MTAITLLFLLGVIFLAFEVFVPGGILGVIGGLFMAGGCVVAFNSYGAIGGLVATVAALAILGVALYAELVLLPRTRLGRQMLVQSKSDGVSQAPLADEGLVMGKDAVAITPLAPTGVVELGGRRYEAFCRSGHAAAGETLRVAGVDNFRLILTKKSS